MPGVVKEEQYERKRRRCTFTLSDQARNFLKNNVTNASRFVDELIKGAEKGIQSAIVTVSAIASGPAEIRTQDLRHVKATSYPADPSHESGEGVEIQSGFKSDESVKSFKNRAGTQTGESLNDFYKRHKKDFVAFMKTEKVSVKTIKDYISTLDRLKPISSPPDIGRYQEMYGEVLSSKVEKAVGKLLRYVKVRQASTSFLGYDHELWRVQFNALKAAAEESTDTSRVKDLTPGEIIAGYHRLDENLKPFYAFLAYTGMRAEQAYDVLTSWRDEKVEEFSVKVDGKAVKFCRYATSDVSRGKKMSYYAFFPTSLHKQIRTYKLPNTLSTMVKKIRELATADEARPINASNLRKYAVNMLRRNQAVDWDVAEYIQGRRPKGVGQARYLSLKDLATEQYPIALHKNMPDLLNAPKPEGKKERPRLAPVIEPEVPTKGKDLQALWVQHRDKFREWCYDNDVGLVWRTGKRGGTSLYLSHPPKVISALQNSPHVTKPQDLKSSRRTEVTALRMFVTEFLPSVGEGRPLGFSPSQWREAISYNKSEKET